MGRFEDIQKLITQSERDLKILQNISVDSNPRFRNRQIADKNTKIKRETIRLENLKAELSTLEPTPKTIIPDLIIQNNNAAIEEFNNMPTASQTQTNQGLTTLQKAILAFGLAVALF